MSAPESRAPRILLGVSGSIAAYKAAELTRQFRRRGCSVQVALTAGAQRFITPLTFEALTKRPVLTDLWAAGQEIEHVERAYEVDAIVIAPATANLIARLAQGLADDILTTTILSSRAPLVIAPAMETQMWMNPATQENVQRLISRGATFVGPGAGDLASGRAGLGRLVELDEIVRRVESILAHRQSMQGEHFVITAGPTIEALDPVRFLTNRSTGAMGIHIAEAAISRGATCDLILGPTHLSVSGEVETTRVESADEMLAACAARIERASVLVCAAAVSDYRPARARASKLKRSDPAASTLTLEENPDILKTLASDIRTRGQSCVVVGFAAETESIEANAKDKLNRKRCDLVVANQVGPGVGFGPGQTEVTVVSRTNDTVSSGQASKPEVADFVLDQVARMLTQQKSE